MRPRITQAVFATRRRLMQVTAENVVSFIAGKRINLVN
jgi:hypothetical protein